MARTTAQLANWAGSVRFDLRLNCCAASAAILWRRRRRQSESQDRGVARGPGDTRWGNGGEVLGLPFVTVCNALALNPDPAVPPAVTPWRYRRGVIWRFRNALGDMILRWAAKPILREINARRLRHGLRPLTGRVSESASLAQVAQQPAFFDYPRERLPESFHYTGPWHAIEAGDKSEFPWEKLDGRPLIYASMGTLQNRQQSIFETIAAACAELGAPARFVTGKPGSRVGSEFCRETNRCAIRPTARSAPTRCVDDHACRAKYCARVPGTGSADGRDSNYERSTGSCESFGVVGCCGSYPAITPHCFASSRKSAAGLKRTALPREGAAMESGDRSCRGSLTSSQHRRAGH